MPNADPSTAANPARAATRSQGAACGAADQPREPIIQLADVHAAYPGARTEALAGITLDVMPGEYLCVLGGNGSGKSTLVQVMNALMAPVAGSVRIDGLDAADPACAPAIRRRVASVFQHPDDQMVTSIVADDVAFGPENLCVPQLDIAERVRSALADVGMLSYANADPADLSGGQQQRVAIAGALAMRPRILLLDEPAAMLDTSGRRDIQRIVARLHRQGITIIHVTHFMDDALRADRVAVLNGGRIVLAGTPQEVFAHRSELRALGLDMPFHLQLQERLEQLGHPCRHCSTEEELLDELASQIRGGHPHGATGAATPQVCPAWDAAPTGPAESSNTAESPSLTGPSDPAGPADPAAADKAPRTAAAIAFEEASFSHAAPAPRTRPRGKGPCAGLRRLLGSRRAQQVPAAAPWALRNATARIAPGELTAIIGRTGSGKSTALELACALKLPTSGNVNVCGIDTADLARRRELRACVGYVSQLPERQLFAESVREDIAFGPANLGLAADDIERRVADAAAMLNLPADPDFLQRSPFALSGGQQRSVALAGVLAMRQPVLVLDEPMAGLDPAGRTRLRGLLKQLRRAGTTIVFVTHDMNDVAELADRVIALDEGRIIADGAPAKVFAPALRRICAQASCPSSEVADATPGSVQGPASIPDTDALAELGLPSAAAFAAHLAQRTRRIGTSVAVTAATTAQTAACGTQSGSRAANEPATAFPLTLEELAYDIARTLEEVAAHGATR